MKKILLKFFVFSLVVFSSCFSNKKVSTEKENPRCHLVEVNFSIDTQGFGNFKEEMNSFLETKHEFEVLYVFRKGGNPSEARLERSFLDKDGQWKKIILNGTGQKSELIIAPTELELLIKNVDEKSFMLDCDHTLGTNRILILIKSQNRLFKYLTTPWGNSSLSDQDLIKITPAILVIDYLETYQQ